MKNKIDIIINDLYCYTQKERSIRRVVEFAKCIFTLNEMSDFFNWHFVRVINHTGEVHITYPDGRSQTIKCKRTKLSMLYETLASHSVDIDSFDHTKDSIKNLDKFIEKYETDWSTQCALYHFSGESAGFFLNDYVNETTLQPEDICWELQENV